MARLLPVLFMPGPRTLVQLLILGFGTFAVGTGSYVYLGLLGGLARELQVDIKTAGQLAAAFAAAVPFDSPCS